MFLWLVFLGSMVWTLTFWHKRRHMYRLASKIPKSKNSLPLVGIVHTLIGNSENRMNRLKEYCYEAMQHNGILNGWLGHKLFILLLHPADLEVVLKTCLDKDDDVRFPRKLTVNGGITAPGTTLGVKLNAQENPDSPFLNAMSGVLKFVSERLFYLWLQPDWMYRLFPQYKKHESSMNLLHHFTDEVIKKRKKELKLGEKITTEIDHEYELGLHKSKTFLDLLMHLSGSEKGLTDVELREEILTLVIAGTDTSAVAIGYTLQLLSKYPDVQEKVYQELCNIYDDDRLLVKEDLTKLPYLERVVKETIRLFPPVPFIIRKNLEDIKLPSGHVLPAGCEVICSIWGVNRDPKYWGIDAEKFDPDRFLPERFKLAYPCSYMPFSNGPRNCIGYKYALMSIKTTLATILRSYKVVEDREVGPTPNIRVKYDIMLKAVDGHQVALERRGKIST